LKILHIAYDAGGIHTRLYHDIISAFREAGHEVIETYLAGAPAPDYRTPADRVVALGYQPAQLKGWRRLLIVRQLRDFIEREAFDVIISHRRKPAELMARASRGLTLYKRLAVWHDEGEFKRWRNCIGAARLFRDFILVGVSTAVRNDILGSRAKFRPEQVIAIDNAIDVDRLEQRLLDRAEARAALGLPETAFVFGNIGRLVPKKGQADLIRAFAPLAAADTRVHLLIIGQGRSKTELEALVIELGLQQRVSLPGAIPEAFRYARAFDVFALPSYREGLPIALLEAACARLPIIASAIGGSRAVLGELGSLVPAGAIEALSGALTQYAQRSPDDLREEGAALYRRLREHFDRPIMLAAYRDLLAASPAE
jgi:glycosyltransferase involved in cell wall biosynthesis